MQKDRTAAVSMAARPVDNVHPVGANATTQTHEAQPRTVLRRFSAGAPRGSWPAEEYAARLRHQGRTAHVVMDLDSDAFLVVDDTPQAVAA